MKKFNLIRELKKHNWQSDEMLDIIELFEKSHFTKIVNGVSLILEIDHQKDDNVIVRHQSSEKVIANYKVETKQYYDFMEQQLDFETEKTEE